MKSVIILIILGTIGALALSQISARSQIQTPNALKNILSQPEINLAVNWDDLGQKMASEGVIDAAKFDELYQNRGLDEKTKQLLSSAQNKTLTISLQNAAPILALLWGLGLANKNEVLEKGPMSNPSYGSPAKFASVGGWTLAKGAAMDHYGKHELIILTPTQQSLVEKIAKNIYRPCCDNSTYFPDCNHGMAMLGLIELLVKNNFSEAEIYQIALQINAYWFPTNYEVIGQYLAKSSLNNISAREILGKNFSGASGYQKIAKLVKPPLFKFNASGCGL